MEGAQDVSANNILEKIETCPGDGTAGVNHDLSRSWKAPLEPLPSQMRSDMEDLR
jgi:hypothetical protein